MRILLRDGQGLRPCARRLHKGVFVWPRDKAPQPQLCQEQWTVLWVGCPGETAAIQATIEQFAIHRHKVAVFGAHGRCFAEQTFSVDRMLDRFETQYSGMV